MNAHHKNMQVSRSVRNKDNNQELGSDRDFNPEILSSDVSAQINKRRKSSGKSKTGKNPQIFWLPPRDNFVIIKFFVSINRSKKMISKCPDGRMSYLCVRVSI